MTGPTAAQQWATLDQPWREAQRTPPRRIGPHADELGVFATVISRIGPALTPAYEQALRTLSPSDAATADLVHELADGGEIEHLAALEPSAAFGYLWPRLRGPATA